MHAGRSRFLVPGYTAGLLVRIALFWPGRLADWMVLWMTDVHNDEIWRSGPEYGVCGFVVYYTLVWGTDCTISTVERLFLAFASCILLACSFG